MGIYGKIFNNRLNTGGYYLLNSWYSHWCWNRVIFNNVRCSMKIKAGEVEETVKNIMNRYLSGGEIEQNEFEYIKKYSRYLKNYKFIKR